MFTQDALAGQTIFVTGASSGIGRRTAQLLARSGARLILSGRDVGRLDESMGMLSGTGHATVSSHLENADDVADLIKSLAAEHGELNGIFHSAGTELVRPMRMTKKPQIDTVFASVQAAMGIARATSLKNVLSDGGSLVFMSSVAGQRGTAGMVAYSAAKAAIDGMVRSLACELAPRRIRVNSIAAGAIATEMHDRLSLSLSEEGLAVYEERHLLGFGRPEDVANAALFLLSGASSWITGTTMLVDGGFAAR
jgi:NAD(P)-dependent dehydrogenase (short-subunit alcohol dehydrogenase family)